MLKAKWENFNFDYKSEWRMISIKDIERVNHIIDRELSFLELQPNANQKSMRVNNWLFVQETFRKLCLERAIAEGIIKPKNGCQK